MSASALTFLLCVWAVILTMTGYCFLKLMTSKIQLSDMPDHEPPSTAIQERPSSTDITDQPPGPA